MKYSCILLLATLFTNVVTYGQIVTFQYDKSGNRTSRTTISTKSTSSATIETTNLNTNESNSKSDILEEHLGNFSVVVYPNPVSGELKVDIMDLDENTFGKIAFYDQNGRLLIFIGNLSKKNFLDLSAIENGVYYLVLQLGDEKRQWIILKE